MIHEEIFFVPLQKKLEDLYGEERKHKKCEVDRIPRGSGRGEWIENVWGNVV